MSGHCSIHGCFFDGNYCPYCRQEGRHLMEDKAKVDAMRSPGSACPVHGNFFDGKECPYCRQEREKIKKCLQK